MTLFDDISRTDESLKSPNISIFRYLNISARPEIGRIRAIIEDWYTRYPDVEDKRELRNRFKSNDDYMHYGAFYELFNFELFTKLGFRLTIHPDIPESTKHPDFLASKKGEDEFYVESTICSPSLEEQNQYKLLEDVINKIDQLNIFDYQLYFEYTIPPKTPISKKKLEREISEKLELLKTQGSHIPRISDDFTKAPIIKLNIENFAFSLTVFQKELSDNKNTIKRNIFMRMGPAYKITSDQALRSTITGKAKKYKNLDKPFLLSIDYLDHKNIELDDFDIGNALFGSEQAVYTLDSKHSIKDVDLRRKLNGALFTTQGPIYQRLSAVMFSSNITSSNFEVRTPEIWFLPYPNLPLVQNSFSLPRRIPNINKGEMTEVEGKEIKRILNL
jgi:hypothetical protein